MVSLSLSFPRDDGNNGRTFSPKKIKYGRACSACAQTKTMNFVLLAVSKSLAHALHRCQKAQSFPPACPKPIYWLGYYPWAKFVAYDLFFIFRPCLTRLRFSKASINLEKCDFSWVKSATPNSYCPFSLDILSRLRPADLLFGSDYSHVHACLCSEISTRHLHHGLGLHRQIGEEHTYLRWWWIETCMHMPPVRNQATTVIPNILWIQAYTTSIHGPARSLYIQTPQMNVPCQQVTNHPPALPSIVLLFSSLSTDQREKAQLQSSWRAGNQ